MIKSTHVWNIGYLFLFQPELKRKLREAHFERGGEGLKDLDLSMKGKTDDIGNDIVKWDIFISFPLFKELKQVSN